MINIERVISKTPMVIADYFTEDGLLKQVGLVKEYWNRIVVKELTDNALDAIEPLQDKKVFMDIEEVCAELDIMDAMMRIQSLSPLKSGKI